VVLKPNKFEIKGEKIVKEPKKKTKQTNKKKTKTKNKKTNRVP
jgi:hypothetical protein